MTRRSLVGVVFAVVLALSAFAAASASALAPELLPAEAGVTFTSAAGAGEFGEGLFAIKSTSQAGSGESAAGGKNGSFTDVFKGSKDALGRTCTGLSDTTAGNVTVTGTYSLRGAKEGTTLITVVAFKINEVHLACGTELIKVKGSVLGKITAPTAETLVSTVTILLATNGSGDQQWIEALNEANTANEKFELKALLNDKNEGLTSQTGTITLSKFTKAGKEKTVLLMPA